MVVWLFLAVPWICLQFVIVVFPDHTYYFQVISLSAYRVYGYVQMYMEINVDWRLGLSIAIPFIVCEFD